MYYYILGCGIACLVLFGINSMDTVDVKPAEILGKVILWPTLSPIRAYSAFATPRMVAFRPGQSPPEVRMPTRFFIS